MEDSKEKPKSEAPQVQANTAKVPKSPAPKSPAPKSPAPKAGAKAEGKFAVILIRNITKSSGAVRDTLAMLRLHKKFACSTVENNRVFLGMLQKVKDYATYGEIDNETLKLMEQKRGQKDSEGKTKTVFHLHPPIGGFERKGIKRNFIHGGALGYRGTKINDLIKKML